MNRKSALILSGVLGTFFSTSAIAALNCTASPDCAYSKCAACTNTACAFRVEMEAPEKVRESAGAEGSGDETP